DAFRAVTGTLPQWWLDGRGDMRFLGNGGDDLRRSGTGASNGSESLGRFLRRGSVRGRGQRRGGNVRLLPYTLGHRDAACRHIFKCFLRRRGIPGRRLGEDEIIPPDWRVLGDTHTGR